MASPRVAGRRAALASLALIAVLGSTLISSVDARALPVKKDDGPAHAAAKSGVETAAHDHEHDHDDDHVHADSGDEITTHWNHRGHKCIHDTYVVPELLPRHFNASAPHPSEYEGYVKPETRGRTLQSAVPRPFRIHADYQLDTVSASVRETIESHVMPHAIRFLERKLQVKNPVEGNLKLHKSCRQWYYWTQNGQRKYFCMAYDDKCLGSADYKAAHMESHIVCDFNTNSCAEPTAAGVGLPNTDFVIYVTAIHTERCETGTIAWAGACAKDPITDRPTAGSVNFCPSQFGPDKDFASMFSTAIHEIFHAIGFSSSLYPFYRDDQGAPYTPREDGVIERAFTTPNEEKREIEFFWPDKEQSPTTFGSNNGAVSETVVEETTARGHTVRLVKTPNVVAQAKAHFGCNSLVGMELENHGGGGTRGSHWEERTMASDMMTGRVYSGGSSVFSKITMGLFEDTGWYKPNYEQAGPFLWGEGRGCDFLSGDCSGNAGALADVFKPYFAEEQIGCTWDYRGYGPSNQCETSYLATGFPSTSDSCWSDGCDMRYSYSSRRCDDSTNTITGDPGFDARLGWYRGEESRCIPVTSTAMKASTSPGTGQWWGYSSYTQPAGCYKTRCDNGDLYVSFGDSEVRCPTGQMVTLDGQATTGGWSLIEDTGDTTKMGPCPDNAVICSTTAASCPSDCTDASHGMCVNGACVCHHSWTGSDCSVQSCVGGESVYTSMPAGMAASSLFPDEKMITCPASDTCDVTDGLCKTSSGTPDTAAPTSAPVSQAPTPGPTPAPVVSTSPTPPPTTAPVTALTPAPTPAATLAPAGSTRYTINGEACQIPFVYDGVQYEDCGMIFGVSQCMVYTCELEVLTNGVVTGCDQYTNVLDWCMPADGMGPNGWDPDYSLTRTTIDTLETCELPFVYGKGDKDCVDESGNYNGNKEVTKGGLACKPWSENTPGYTFPVLPNLPSNFCRSSPRFRINGASVPFCFTDDPVSWFELCDIPSCGTQTDCFVPYEDGYRGDASVTQSGAACVSWASMGYRSVYGFGNGARNPDNEALPWCFTADCNGCWGYVDQTGGLEMCSDSVTPDSTYYDCTTDYHDGVPWCKTVSGGFGNCDPDERVTTKGVKCDFTRAHTDGIVYKDCFPGVAGSSSTMCYVQDTWAQGAETGICKDPKWETHLGTSTDSFAAGFGANDVSTTDPMVLSLSEGSSAYGSYNVSTCSNPDHEMQITGSGHEMHSCPVEGVTASCAALSTCTGADCAVAGGFWFKQATNMQGDVTGAGDWWTLPFSIDKFGNVFNAGTEEAYVCVFDRLYKIDSDQLDHLRSLFMFDPLNSALQARSCTASSDGTSCITTTYNYWIWLPEPDLTECYTQADGSDYRGEVADDVNGRVCQAWSSQSPTAHKYTPEDYPADALYGNFCRNPSGDSQPWCFVETPGTGSNWGYCDVGYAHATCDSVGTPGRSLRKLLQNTDGSVVTSSTNQSPQKGKVSGGHMIESIDTYVTTSTGEVTVAVHPLGDSALNAFNAAHYAYEIEILEEQDWMRLAVTLDADWPYGTVNYTVSVGGQEPPPGVEDTAGFTVLPDGSFNISLAGPGLSTYVSVAAENNFNFAAAPDVTDPYAGVYPIYTFDVLHLAEVNTANYTQLSFGGYVGESNHGLLMPNSVYPGRRRLLSSMEAGERQQVQGVKLPGGVVPGHGSQSWIHELASWHSNKVAALDKKRLAPVRPAMDGPMRSLDGLEKLKSKAEAEAKSFEFSDAAQEKMLEEKLMALRAARAAAEQAASGQMP